jgi:hypothetical protein
LRLLFYELHDKPWGYLGPNLRTPNPGFNPGFTPHIFYIEKRGGVNPGLNTRLGVLRCGLCTPFFTGSLLRQYRKTKFYIGPALIYCILYSTMFVTPPLQNMAAPINKALNPDYSTLL